MAYDKHVWQCGEAITTEKLNHMEDGIASGGGGAGYECTEELTALTEESITTTAQGDNNIGTLSYSLLIDADSIIVTFDGVEYECPRISVDNSYIYGGYTSGPLDFSEYPFVIASNSDQGNMLATETAGTHSIEIKAVEYTATHIDPCFKAAVRSDGSVEVNAEETALKCYRIDLRSSAGTEIPAKDKAPVTMSILSTSENTSINTLHAAWGSINHSLSNALVVPKSISHQSAYVDVYNFGDSAIILDSNSNNYIEAKIMSFKSERVKSACVLLGEGCDGGK